MVRTCVQIPCTHEAPFSPLLSRNGSCLRRQNILGLKLKVDGMDQATAYRQIHSTRGRACVQEHSTLHRGLSLPSLIVMTFQRLRSRRRRQSLRPSETFQWLVRHETSICRVLQIPSLASNQAQPLLIWWRRDLGLGASKNRRICNHYVFKVVSQNLAYWQRVVFTWADVGPGAERHNSHRCTCMLTMLNSEKTLVLYVLRLGRFVSSMSWCLESALRRCELRHSVTLKAELRRSIEVVLAGHHFVADLSTWFREVTDLPYCY